MAIDRVTFGPGGYGFDELVADDASVHVERMANNHVWMAIESGGRRVVLNLHSSRWLDEVKRWAHLQGLTVARIVGTPQQRMAALRTPADVHTINREQIPWLEAQFFQNGQQVMRWPWDVVANDESQGFKSQSAQRFKSLYRMRWGAERAARQHI